MLAGEGVSVEEKKGKSLRLSVGGGRAFREFIVFPHQSEIIQALCILPTSEQRREQSSNFNVDAASTQVSDAKFSH